MSFFSLCGFKYLSNVLLFHCKGLSLIFSVVSFLAKILSVLIIWECLNFFLIFLRIVGYGIFGWWNSSVFWICHILISMVSDDKSSVNLIEDSLCLMSCFSFALFNLSLALNSLNMMQLSSDLCESIQYRGCRACTRSVD